MANNQPSQELPVRRVFLRVPLKTTAKIFLEQQSPQEVDLNDISSDGLSFYMPASQTLPDYIDIEFHLEPSGRAIKTKVAVKGRVPAGDKTRVGCSFFAIKDVDKNLITRHICRLTNLAWPLKILTIATLLCYLDGILRIPAYLLYCRGVEFERLAQISFPTRFYFLIILLYAGCAATGFILSGRPVEKFGKLRFLVSIGCLIGAFVFVLVKALTYLTFSIGNPLPMFIDVLIWAYIIFAIYSGYAVILGVTWARKIEVALQLLERHSSFGA